MFVRQMHPGIAFVPAMLASPPCVPYHLPCAAASVLCLSQGSVHLSTPSVDAGCASA